ncbi:MAG: NAD(P)H-binding protein [Acidimicrobiia bacterium]|nr:NAD(P)H-binding protein [Acidimicrobiia bacterium]
MATESPLHVVTGAFGYTGRYIARNLLSRGLRVRTLTNSIHRANPFGNAVEVHPIDFDDHERLVESLRGASALYNTYWVRYDYRSGTRDFGYDLAVSNTRTLFDCARSAGVGRVVHVSVANASADSAWGYFQGKARLEADLRGSGLPYSIVRPTVIFGGPENVLINNIAWLLRRLPVFGLFGRGDYRLTPVHVDDVAQICVDAALGDQNVTLDAVGPETFTYRQMIHEMTRAMGLRRLIVSLPESVTLLAGRAIGAVLKDIVITGHEISGLRDELMYTGTEPLGTKSFTDWLQTEAPTLGRRYTNDLTRRR